MKSIYSLIFLMLFALSSIAQNTDQPPANPTPAPPKPIPVLLQAGDLPYTGTTLNQDYNSVGINPANLGLVTTGPAVVTFGLIGLSGGITTDAVGFSTFAKFFTDSLPYQQALTQGFTNHGASLSFNIMPIGISVQIPKIGGFAFTIQDRVLMNMYMNPTFASVVFNGYNSPYFNRVVTDSSGNHIGIANTPQTIAQAFDGSYVKGSYTRTYALSYGRELFKLNDNSYIYGGVSLKYISGFGFADGYTDGNTVTAFLAYSTKFSSFGDSTQKVSPASIALAGPTQAGHGEGFDLGGTIVINKNIRASASITDVGLGDMTWGGVTYQVINSNVDSLKKYEGAGSLFKGGLKSSILFEHPSTFTEALPTQLHLGGSIFLISKFVVAADMDIPLNSVGGNLEQPVITLSGGYSPSNGFRVTLGFQSSAYTNITVPLGIVVGTGPKATWQWGVSYEDMLNFFRSNSIALGGSFFFLRFRI